MLNEVPIFFRTIELQLNYKMGKQNYFIEGRIEPNFVAEQIAKHSSKKNIGAHTIFLGQVRSDSKGGKTVQEIIYSAYNEMAEKEFQNIKDSMFSKYDIHCLHIYHSVGNVKAGELSLFVFLSGKHRKKLFDILKEIVDDIKAKVPIWKKEIYDDGSYEWLE